MFKAELLNIEIGLLKVLKSIISILLASGVVKGPTTLLAGPSPLLL